MRCLLFACLLCGSLLATTATFAQFGNGGTAAVRKIQQTETLVVLDPALYDDAYNEEIQAVFKKYWTFTKFRFISGPQVPKYCKDAHYSFFMQLEMEDNTLTSGHYTDVGLLQGGRCGLSRFDMVSYSTISPYNTEAETYRVELVRAVQMIQNYMQLALDNNLGADNVVESVRLYRKNQATLERATFGVETVDLLEEYQTIDKVKEYYTFPVRVAEYPELAAATLNQRDDLVYHVLVRDIEGFRYHLLIRAKGSQVVFAKEAKRKERVLLGKENLHDFCAKQ